MPLLHMSAVKYMKLFLRNYSNKKIVIQPEQQKQELELVYFEWRQVSTNTDINNVTMSDAQVFLYRFPSFIR